MRVLSCEKSLYLEHGPSIYHTIILVKAQRLKLRKKKKKNFIMRGGVVGEWEGNLGEGL